MKAVVFTEYGSPDVLRLQEVPRPTPKENELLVRVCATPVNYGDLTARNFANSAFNMPALLYLPARMAFGWNRPKINVLGSELAGDVAAVGRRVTKFKPGDAVFAYVGMKMGANAEYICLPEHGSVTLKPANLAYDEAATLPYGAIMAVSLLQKARLQPGQKILINGASGGIGGMAVQLAKAYGADVTGVCGTLRREYVSTLGADQVIDYTEQDFTQNGERYDVILDILGRTCFARCKNSLTPNGILLFASFKSRALFDMFRTSFFNRKKVICTLANEHVDSLLLVKELAEAGKIKAPLEQRFPLEQTAAAHRYVEAGHRQGKVVIMLNHTELGGVQ
ncbi:NAD(P)-dependent alcohol dehydrogenase [Candidatus Chloroploca sp. Khr17]|uniref:NAD(P)-dependent alcohol dehydrogenase n=1 Tax=Candidatus Chloroploca sp. Khr17 TaxID=2496869 RepID=UPI00101D8113|nr:NAD(P)-dependent alcohol dehydrogenase [Candidatus Chloroploca sp. Khr17]